MKCTQLLTALLFATLLPTVVHAQTWPALDTPTGVEKTGKDDIAVVVAIEDYAFLPDVPGAKRNAADWEQFLKRELGVRTVLMLVDQRAVREDILAFTERAAAGANAEGTLWFVFVGHGAPATTDGEGLLIGADGQQNTTSIDARGVRQSEILERLGIGAQRRTVVVLDACFSGRDRSGESLAVGTMPVVAAEGSPALPANTVILTAARSDEVAGALPGSARPAFSYLALGALRGWADTGDESVTAEELVDFARRELMQVEGRGQTPQIAGATNLVLSRGALEARPGGSVISDVGTSSVATSDAATVTTNEQMHTASEAVDHVPDFPLYVFGQGTFGTRSDFADPGLGTTFGAGYKLNYGTLSRNEWRVGARVNIFGTRNDNAPEPGDVLTNSETGFVSQFDDNDSVEQARATVVLGAAEFGRAWRVERARAYDRVLAASVFAGVGAQPTRCQRFEIDTYDNIARCAERAAPVVFGGGVAGQAQWGPLMVGVQLGYVYDAGALAVLTAGFVLDP